MKAEEIKEIYPSISKNICEGYQHEDIISAMWEYAKQKCKEQRQICYGSFLCSENILDAREPIFD